MKTEAPAFSNLNEPDLHEAQGRHLLLTLSDCAQTILLNDMESLKALTHRAAEATGATILNICAQQFSPQGITVVAVLAESHASLHTYPEVGKVFWDCFTCGTTCDPQKSISVLEEALKPEKVTSDMIHRQ
jgi:S-adenosylmethionine decarboxylase